MKIKFNRNKSDISEKYQIKNILNIRNKVNVNTIHNYHKNEC
jgi:hypothetical protein